MPGTQADAAGIVATALGIDNINTIAIKALEMASDRIEELEAEKKDLIEILTHAGQLVKDGQPVSRSIRKALNVLRDGRMSQKVVEASNDILAEVKQLEDQLEVSMSKKDIKKIHKVVLRMEESIKELTLAVQKLVNEEDRIVTLQEPKPLEVDHGPSD